MLSARYKTYGTYFSCFARASIRSNNFCKAPTSWNCLSHVSCDPPKATLKLASSSEVMFHREPCSLAVLLPDGDAVRTEGVLVGGDGVGKEPEEGVGAWLEALRRESFLAQK